MKKYLLSLLLLFLCSGLLYQWFRADKKLSHCDARIATLQKDLNRIEKYRYLLADLDKEIIETDRQIALLHKRLPTRSDENAFINKLIHQFKEHDIEASLQFSETKEKDFYREITLTFAFNGAVPYELIIWEIVHNMERLAQRESEQGQPLRIKVYSSILALKPTEIKPCTTVEQEVLNYWPFNSKVRECLKQVDEKCAQRNKDKAILIKIRELETRTLLFIPLQEIVSQLALTIEQNQ